MHLLLVEDDEALRDALEALLTEAGFKVVAVSSAEAALEEAEKRKFAMVVTDLDLVGRDGEWLLTELQRRELHPADRMMRITARSTGRLPPGTLRKPFGGATLLAAINRRLGARIIEVFLYVTGPVHDDQEAVIALRGLLDEFEPPLPPLTILDVRLDRTLAQTAGVVITPTVMIHTVSGRPIRVVGEPSIRRDALRDALRAAGLQLRR